MQGQMFDTVKRNTQSNVITYMSPSQAQWYTVPKVKDGSTCYHKEEFIKDSKVVGISIKEKCSFYAVYLVSYTVGNGTFKISPMKHMRDINYCIKNHLFA